MSASREKKTRQDVPAQGPTPREQKRQEEEREERRTKLLYRTVGAICVLVAVAVVIWNSGLVQRTATAVNVNGEKYTAADVQYHLRSVMAQSGISSTYAASMQSMVMNQETGETMYDYMVDQAVNELVSTSALAAQAEAEGFTMTAETQALMEEQLAELEAQAVTNGFRNRGEYLRAIYGSYMTYNRFVSLYSRNLLVSDYVSAKADALVEDQSALEGYYQENADTMDSYTLTLFTFRAEVATTDANGTTIEMTDDEQAEALSQAQSELKAVAEELQAKLEAGEDPQALSDEYTDQLAGAAAISQSILGSSLNSSYSEWAMDAARSSGDVTLVEAESTTTSSYIYVVRFEGRDLDESTTSNVRHILITAETDEGATAPTQEQLDAAQAEAQALLDEWKAGEATESSFSLLAQEHSEDSGSASSGGLISGITADAAYVETFRDWAMDASRQEGDTGLVQSEYGWHIMYYVDDTKVWEQTAQNGLLIDWEEEATEGYEGVRGMGMRFVTL